ncbi:hypothetical protein V495_02433 [Pseudogymnoascus sp. VKM F-4514 (FW-929)]|nr:hypothetical protein V495_02433 [Pseudogymnoascus sp. VKM F-4514 (FW-929)]KFY61501.1 hypothetical protein V497_02913 [Pseudogymnoascus sp. VKM F-4516 (FW-969)]
MSFGWSVGDLIAGLEVAIRIANALQDAGGAAEKYRQTTTYLLSLSTVLHQLHPPPPGLLAIGPDVQSVHSSLQAFHSKLSAKFEKSLGSASSDWVARIRSSPKKIEYALFMEKQVEALRIKLDVPLKAISLALGIATHKQSRENGKIGKETLGEVVDLKAALPGLEKTILAGVEDIVVASVQRDEVERTYTAVGEWCRAVPVADTFQSHLREMAASSCQWIFRRDEFMKWRGGGPEKGHLPVLWITGIPGSGKTRLATRIVESLKGEGSPVAYFYCDTKDERRRSAMSILRTWTWQVLEQRPLGLGEVAKIRAKEPVPGEGSMEKALMSAVAGVDGLVFVLDGLDECEEETRKKLYPIVARLAATARVLIVSREMPGSHRPLKSALPHEGGLVFYRIVEGDNTDDINDYLDRAVKELEIGDEEVESTVISKLQEGASGMFLWATLIRPTGLVGRAVCEDTDYAECEREDERSHATTLLIAIDDEVLKSRSRMPDDKLRDTLLRYCGSLVAIHESRDGGSPTVTLVHASVKDFLLEQSSSKEAFGYLILDPEETQAILAQECLTYISYNNIDFDPNTMQPDEPSASFPPAEMGRRFEAYMEQYPLLVYASLNWFLHLVIAPHGRTYTSLTRFCTSIPKTIAWLQVMLRYRGDRSVYSSSPGYADYRGIATLEHVLPQHVNELRKWLKPFHHVVEERSNKQLGRTSLTRYQQFMFCGMANDFLPKLSVAAYFDYTEYLEDCLKKGMDPNVKNYRGKTPIFAAAMAESLEAAKVLIKYGADPNIIGPGGVVALHSAIRLDDWRNPNPVPFRVAEFLIESGADPCYGNGGLLALACLCASSDDTHIVSLVSCMLKHGATKVINIGKNPFWTALHWAAKAKAPRLVSLLLENGAEVDIGFGGDRVNARKFETPLDQACSISAQSEDVVRILLEAGATVDALHRDGRTPLHLSCRQSLGISKLLLEHGANVNAVAHDGNRPLHDAVRHSNIPLMDMLIAKGAAVDVKNVDGLTPLDLALEVAAPDTRVVTALVDAGASAPRNAQWELEVVAKGEVWIKKRERKEEYWPQKPRDVFEAFWLLQRHATSKALPRNIVVNILDLGRYWLRSYSNRADLVALDEGMALRAPPYLSSEPIIGRSLSPIRELTFDIVSHDQAFSSYPECYGTYDNSWTYFEFGVQTKEGEEPFNYEGLERRLCVNVHAQRLASTHRAAFKYYKHGGLLKRIKAGDRVQVFAQARFPGPKTPYRPLCPRFDSQPCLGNGAKRGPLLLPSLAPRIDGRLHIASNRVTANHTNQHKHLFKSQYTQAQPSTSRQTQSKMLTTTLGNLGTASPPHPGAGTCGMKEREGAGSGRDAQDLARRGTRDSAPSTARNPRIRPRTDWAWFRSLGHSGDLYGGRERKREKMV